MDDVTPEQTKAACIGAGIDYIEHHDCGVCGGMVHFKVHDDGLYFYGNCCYGGGSGEPRPWSDASDWINMQSNPESKVRIAALFGLSNDS